MDITLHTPFSQLYDNFLSKITDDMFMELTELDTYRILEELLMTAIHKFEFPRVNLDDFILEEFEDQSTYQGIESNNLLTIAFLYDEGYFKHKLTIEEINILTTYMIVEWFGYQLASVENTRMKYSGNDFKFSSQANHMQRLLAIKKDYEREGFHLQRLYKRRVKDEFGIPRSTMNIIMEPIAKTKLINTISTSNNSDNDNDDCCKKMAAAVIRHCDENKIETEDYVNSALTWNDF